MRSDKSVYVMLTKSPWARYQKERNRYRAYYLTCAIDQVAGEGLPCRR